MNTPTTIAAVSTCMTISVPTAAASVPGYSGGSWRPTLRGAISERTSAMTATIVKVRFGSLANRATSA